MNGADTSHAELRKAVARTRATREVAVAGPAGTFASRHKRKVSLTRGLSIRRQPDVTKSGSGTFTIKQRRDARSE